MSAARALKMAFLPAGCQTKGADAGHDPGKFVNTGTIGVKPRVNQMLSVCRAIYCLRRPREESYNLQLWDNSFFTLVTQIHVLATRLPLPRSKPQLHRGFGYRLLGIACSIGALSTATLLRIAAGLKASFRTSWSFGTSASLKWPTGSCTAGRGFV